MATQREDAPRQTRDGNETSKTGTDAAPNATPPRKTSDVAPEATAQAARQTVKETTPDTAPPSPAAPAKASGTTPESKRKASRSTASSRRPKTARSTRAASAAKTAASPSRTTATRTARTSPARPGAARSTATPRLAAAPDVAALPKPAPQAGERAGHGFGRVGVDLVDASRTAGRTVVDAVEGAGDRLAAYQEQVARTAPLPWVADLARANADFTRAATKAYVGTARALLKS
jgi:hypothetical protein